MRKKILQFKWYQPVNFGNGITTENWAGTHTKRSYEFGIKKWNFIIERNLPDIQGLRVLDVGCNCGLYCVQLSRMGAKKVVGIDSELTWPSWQEQAFFVKEALEWRCGTKYNISYIDSSMEDIPNLGLEGFDLVLALCCLYYLPEKKIHFLLSYFRDTGCSKIILQGNTNRNDQTLEVFQRAQPKFLAKMLRQAGYDFVSIDQPVLYSRPVVVGSFQSVDSGPQSKRDKLRDWLRRII